MCCESTRAVYHSGSFSFTLSRPISKPSTARSLRRKSSPDGDLHSLGHMHCVLSKWSSAPSYNEKSAGRPFTIENEMDKCICHYSHVKSWCYGHSIALRCPNIQFSTALSRLRSHMELFHLEHRCEWAWNDFRCVPKVSGSSNVLLIFMRVLPQTWVSYVGGGFW